VGTVSVAPVPGLAEEEVVEQLRLVADLAEQAA
jgi:hypothetical protein